jgi:hypothetical protein
VATYLADRDRLTHSNAGHPRPLWYRPEVGQWSVLKPRDGRADDLPARSRGGTANLPLGVDGATLLALHHTAGPSPRLTIRQKRDVYAKVFGLRPV